jgi:hypothetical protein
VLLLNSPILLLSPISPSDVSKCNANVAFFTFDLKKIHILEAGSIEGGRNIDTCFTPQKQPDTADMGYGFGATTITTTTKTTTTQQQ